MNDVTVVRCFKVLSVVARDTDGLIITTVVRRGKFLIYCQSACAL